MIICFPCLSWSAKSYLDQLKDSLFGCEHLAMIRWQYLGVPNQGIPSIRHTYYHLLTIMNSDYLGPDNLYNKGVFDTDPPDKFNKALQKLYLWSWWGGRRTKMQRNCWSRLIAKLAAVNKEKEKFMSMDWCRKIHVNHNCKELNKCSMDGLSTVIQWLNQKWKPRGFHQNTWEQRESLRRTWNMILQLNITIFVFQA